jgi:hypothetical protein
MRSEVTDREGNRIPFDLEARVTDIGVTQRIAHIVCKRVEPLALRRGNVDLKQKIGSAAQV